MQPHRVNATASCRETARRPRLLDQTRGSGGSDLSRPSPQSPNPAPRRLPNAADICQTFAKCRGLLPNVRDFCQDFCQMSRTFGKSAFGRRAFRMSRAGPPRGPALGQMSSHAILHDVSILNLKQHSMLIQTARMIAMAGKPFTKRSTSCDYHPSHHPELTLR